MFYEYENEFTVLIDVLDWEDTTEYYDICPSITKYFPDHHLFVKIWLDYEDPDDREMPDSFRYEVDIYDAYVEADLSGNGKGKLHIGEWVGTDLQTDDYGELMSHLKSYRFEQNLSIYDKYKLSRNL